MEEPDYKNFYICVNGSSKSQLIRPSYFIFQLQNIGDVNNFKMFLVKSFTTMWKRRDRHRMRERYRDDRDIEMMEIET